ncbi:probable purine permease 11 [Tanacetum coccineum]
MTRSSPNWKKEYAEKIGFSLLLFIEYLEPPGGKDNVVKPEICLTALSMLCIVDCKYPRAKISRQVYHQMDEWIPWICEHANKGSLIEIDLSIYFKALHSLLLKLSKFIILEFLIFDTILGEGGFRKVYKGWIEEEFGSKFTGSGSIIAVKKLNSKILQGVEGWQVIHTVAKDAISNGAWSSTNPVEIPKTKHYRWWLCVPVYIIFLLAGQATATLLGGIYYDKGDNSKWMATFVQSVGFPILITILLFVPPSIKATSAPPISIVLLLYLFFGLL